MKTLIAKRNDGSDRLYYLQTLNFMGLKGVNTSNPQQLDVFTILNAYKRAFSYAKGNYHKVEKWYSQAEQLGAKTPEEYAGLTYLLSTGKFKEVQKKLKK